MSEVKIEERKKNQTISHKADKIMSIIDIVLCHDRYPFWPPPVMFSQIPGWSEGVGASLQRGVARPSAQHSSQQNPAETPPGHTFPPAHRLRGPAAQTGLSGKPRLHRPHRHRQGQGTCPSTASQTVKLMTRAYWEFPLCPTVLMYWYKTA